MLTEAKTICVTKPSELILISSAIEGYDKRGYVLQSLTATPVVDYVVYYVLVFVTEDYYVARHQ